MFQISILGHFPIQDTRRLVFEQRQVPDQKQLDDLINVVKKAYYDRADNLNAYYLRGKKSPETFSIDRRSGENPDLASDYMLRTYRTNTSPIVIEVPKRDSNADLSPTAIRYAENIISSYQ